MTGGGDSRAKEQIEKYLDELYRWNKKINLTAVKRGEADKTLIRPSRKMAELFPEKTGLKILDIGSGGGIPAIILSILMPDNSFALLDSVKKKCAFLTHVSLALKLENVSVINDRTDNLKKTGDLAGRFDVITSRQVSAETVFKAAIPLLKKGGEIIIHTSPSENYQFEGFEKGRKNSASATFKKL